MVSARTSESGTIPAMDWPNEMIEDILARFRAGETMVSTLALHGRDWPNWCKMAAKRPEVREAWHEARKEGCHAVMEQIRTLSAPDASFIADGSGTQVRAIADPARLRVALDALKFYVSRVHREAYGDSVDLTIRGTLDMRSILSAADQRLARYQRAAIEDATVLDVLPVGAPPVPQLVDLL